MKGLDLSRAFYAACRQTLWAEMPDVMCMAAVGLAGEGSECLGYDDEASHDHDFGPGFCLWLPRAELHRCLPRIEDVFSRLPQQYEGWKTRLAPNRRMGRVGPLAVEDYYAFFTGLERPPRTPQEWLGIAEHQLAACTSGEVFEDASGLFTRWREALLAYYPEDVRLKKLATRCMVMAQAGQYNLPRCLGRGDGLSAMLAAARFAEAALSLVCLLNRRYAPFYKWAGKFVATLPVLGADAARALTALAVNPLRGPEDMPVCDVVEALCASVAAHLRACGLSAEQGNWLWAHGPEIVHHVRDAELRRMDLLQG